MADCQNSNERLFGGAVVLEVADGCSDEQPQETEWKALAAGTSKGFDFSPNSVTSDADDGKGYVETIVTNSDFTISFEGEVRKKDRLDQYGIGRFIKYYHTEISNRRQPGIWVRLEYGPVTFIGYMNITALSSDGGTNDIVSLTTEFKVGDASTIQVIDTDETVPVTGVTVTPTSGSVAAGDTTTFEVNVAPADATDKTFTVKSSDTSIVTATVNGTTVTVTGVEEGSASVTVTTNDGSFTAQYEATVTAP